MNRTQSIVDYIIECMDDIRYQTTLPLFEYKDQDILEELANYIQE